MGVFQAEAYEELSLFVRHSAWLNAKVEQPAKQRIAQQRKPLSRLEEMRLDRKDPDFLPAMPSIQSAHLVAYLWEAGPTLEGSMGNAPLGHADIAAWQRNSGIELQPWEAKFLRSLSREYLVALQQAEKPDCPAPWVRGLPLDERRRQVARKIAQIFG